MMSYLPVMQAHEPKERDLIAKTEAALTEVGGGRGFVAHPHRGSTLLASFQICHEDCTADIQLGTRSSPFGVLPILYLSNIETATGNTKQGQCTEMLGRLVTLLDKAEIDDMRGFAVNNGRYVCARFHAEPDSGMKPELSRCFLKGMHLLLADDSIDSKAKRERVEAFDAYLVKLPLNHYRLDELIADLKKVKLTGAYEKFGDAAKLLFLHPQTVPSFNVRWGPNDISRLRDELQPAPTPVAPPQSIGRAVAAPHL